MHRIPKTVVKNYQSIKILTPNGYETFYGVNRIKKKFYYNLKFSNGTILKCSDKHPLITSEGPVLAKDLTKYDEVLTKSGVGCFLKSKRLIKKPIYLYDIVESGKDHLYYTNNIISHNCQFLGGTHTLINSAKLKTMAWVDPQRREDNLDIFMEPQEDHVYVLTADVAEGQGLDYSAFTIIDVTDHPYKIAAKFRDNTIQPFLYPTVIATAGRMYNDAHVLIEISSTGLEVADILHWELEYDHIIKIQMKGRAGQQLTYGNIKANKVALGIKQSTATKRIGCANLKTLVESDQLQIQDFDIISELNTFTAQKESFKAEDGCNDDLAMSLVIFGWLMSQRVFREMLKEDIRKVLQKQILGVNDEDICPFGFIDDGVNDPFRDEEELRDEKGDRFMEDRKKQYPFDEWAFWKVSL